MQTQLLYVWNCQQHNFRSVNDKEHTNGSAEPSVHTALLADQRRRSRKYSQPSSSSTTTYAAQDTFL